jgi:hypothetical protein
MKTNPLITWGKKACRIKFVGHNRPQRVSQSFSRQEVNFLTAISRQFFINTPLQWGAAEAVGQPNRFNGFHGVQETVETVSGHLPLVNPTLLKQGVNEKCEVFSPAQSKIENLRRLVGGPSDLSERPVPSIIRHGGVNGGGLGRQCLRPNQCASRLNQRLGNLWWLLPQPGVESGWQGGGVG